MGQDCRGAQHWCSSGCRPRLDLGFEWDGELYGDGRAKVRLLRGCEQRDDEAVRRAGRRGRVLPRASDGVDGDEVAVGELGTAAFPDIWCSEPRFAKVTAHEPA